MTIDEAIKHCEEIAMDKTNLAQTLWDSKEKARCEECAEEHNQLAQWLIELKMLKTEQQSSGSENPNNCEMRDATLEERESIDKYIKSISKPTGVKFGALEQEPSGDLISRQAALNEAFEVDTKEYGRIEVVGIDAIDALPSVKPQERTGHWIIYKDCEGKTRECTCDQCGYKTGKYTWHNPNFCSNCGAKMIKPQETKQPEISSYYGLKSYVRERSEE